MKPFVAFVRGLALIAVSSASTRADTIVQYNVHLSTNDETSGASMLVDGTINFDSTTVDVASSALTFSVPSLSISQPLTEFAESNNALGTAWHWQQTAAQLLFVVDPPIDTQQSYESRFYTFSAGGGSLDLATYVTASVEGFGMLGRFAYLPNTTSYLVGDLTASVPEPSTVVSAIAMAVMGIIGLVWRRRRAVA